MRMVLRVEMGAVLKLAALESLECRDSSPLFAPQDLRLQADPQIEVCGCQRQEL